MDLHAHGLLAKDGGESALRLPWHSLTWGSGLKPRQRTAAIAAAPQHNAALLQTAAELAGHDPAAAYQVLYPAERRNAIKYFGAAFFTKFLYFASGGHPDHPSLILDDRVADALHHRCGWRSLRTGGFWPAATYGPILPLAGSMGQRTLRRPRACSTSRPDRDVAIHGRCLTIEPPSPTA